MRSTLQQPNSTATHALLNALEDQNELGNGTMNHVWLVEKLFQTKECEMTFLDKKKCAIKCCDLIYNLPPCIIYTIPEEDKQMSRCTSKLESNFNSNSNSDNNNDKNNGSSSIQNGNKNINNSDSNSNPEIYIALLDLSKEQELK
ncbi:hypothetical protein G9A89_006293 [Geosiphon pyriformis]|nr:hypothetical protein G9A89_006293 [Geosiphon pyriformis]